MEPTPRLRRWLVVAATCLFLFTVVGFFILPPIVRSQAEKRLSAELGRNVTVGKVRLNPYSLSATIEDFDIREKDGRNSFLGWSRLYVNFDALKSLGGDWVLGDVELQGFHAVVGINPDHSFNFGDLLQKLAAKSKSNPESKPGRPFRVSRLKVDNARAEFTDASRSTPFKSQLGPLTFVLSNFRSIGSRGAPYQFTAVTEAGERLSWIGTLAADPVESRGEFEVGNLLLKKYMPYAEDRIQAELTDGKLSVKGEYEFSLRPDGHILKLTNGEIHLSDFKLAERSNANVAAEFAQLDVTGIDADAVAMKAAIKRVAVERGHLALRRGKDGAINFLTMLQPPATSHTVALPATPRQKLPELAVADLSVKDFKIEVSDDAAPRAVSLALGGVQASVRNFSLADNATFPVELSFTTAPQGVVRLNGMVGLKPSVVAELKMDVAAFEILPLSPYLEQFVNARITGGVIASTSTVQFGLGGDAPIVKATGSVLLEKFGLVDSAHNEELAGVGALTLTGVTATTQPQLTVAVDELAMVAPYARVVIDADKSINLLSVVKPGEPASPEIKVAKAPAAVRRPKIDIAVLRVTEGDFTFTDRSVEPNVRMAIGQFAGTVAGLSSENLVRADVDLKGLVDSAGPVAITGKIDPLGERKFIDLKVDFKNVDLVPISPYTGKFAGYELARGKLVVDTRVIIDGKKLDATNVVTLNQFTFGAPTNSPEATSLPVRLGVALLKDTDGKIVIDLPVQGTLGDPNFRIGKVVMRVVVNLLTKAATSPFALLGSMFGGGGEELAYQEFAAGSAELQPTELGKLDTMVKALTNRPGLSLGIEGSYDEAADRYALRRQKLAEMVRRQIWESRHLTDPNIPPPAELEITADENAAMLQKLFDEKFPPGTEFGAPVAAAPPVTAPPPSAKPRRGIFNRVIKVITFGAVGREKRSQPQEEAKKTAAAEPTTLRVGVSVEEMTGRLAETIDVNENDLRALAAARAQRVRDHLINVGHIAPERLFLAQAKAGAKPKTGPRVFLSLQ